VEADRRKDDLHRCLHGSIPLPSLLEVRQRMALSQQDLAKLARVSAGTIRLLENGRRGSYPATLRKLAGALCVAPQELMQKPRPEREEHASR
jgi:transcriptional regulator with XRE-family HTH domain